MLLEENSQLYNNDNQQNFDFDYENLLNVESFFRGD